MKKILFTNYHTGEGGGHTPYIINLIKHLSPYLPNVDMQFACPLGSSLQKKAMQMVSGWKAEFIFKYGSPLITWKCIKNFNEICNRWSPEIVHTNAAQDMNIALIVRKLFKHKFKIVRTQHAIRHISASAYHRAFYNSIDAYIYPSQAAMITSSAGGLLPKNACVIEHGIDTHYFKPISKDLELAQRIGIKEDDFVFGSCAGLKDYKRVDLMIRAAAHIHKNFKPLNYKINFKILVLGEEQHWHKLLPMVIENDLKDIVIYGGNREDVRPYVSLFDIGFILSDAVETLSYASREMMAMGVPLISSNFSGLPDNVNPFKDGFVITAGSADAVKDALESALIMHKVTPLSLHEMGDNARAKAVEKFDIQIQMNKYLTLYKSLL